LSTIFPLICPIGALSRPALKAAYHTFLSERSGINSASGTCYIEWAKRAAGGVGAGVG